MSQLRLEDTTPAHPKLLQIPRADRWTWFEVLAYCARYQTGGTIPKTISEAVPAATPDFLALCASAGLFDGKQGSLVVHDWTDYNPRNPGAADRQGRYRARQNGKSKPKERAKR